MAMDPGEGRGAERHCVVKRPSVQLTGLVSRNALFSLTYSAATSPQSLELRIPANLPFAHGPLVPLAA